MIRKYKMDRGNTPTPPLLEGIDRSSPPPACAICLGQFRNKSFAENCLHQFCFECLLTWSKIKPECPLCKQPFRNIMHNVRANDVYDKYLVDQRDQRGRIGRDEPEIEPFYSPRYRYRATLTLHPRDNLAVQRLLLGYHHPPDPLGNQPGPPAPFAPHHRSYNSFRRNVYRQNLWVCPLPDFTGRFRDVTPQFYRNNPAQVTRLVMWLSRELPALVLDPTHVLLAIRRITDLIVIFPITSVFFREGILSLVPNHTEHFIHEFYSFARSPFDLVGYDRSVAYQRGGPQPSDNYVYEILVSENENSTDSDVFLVSPEAGPSNSTSLNESRSYTPPGAPNRASQRNLAGLSNPVVIETLSHSETEDSSDEVVMVRYIKPPQDRTPEIVDLVASDSDAVIIEESAQPSPCEVMDLSPTGGPQDLSSPSLPSTSGLVKLSVKSNPSQFILLSDTNSESDSKGNNKEKSKYLRWRYLKKKSAKDNASTEYTDRDSNDDSEDSSSSSSTVLNKPVTTVTTSFNDRTFKKENPFQTRMEDDSKSQERLSKDNHLQPSTSANYDIPKKHKIKTKKLSKKSVHSSKKKHKVKSKSKKRHKSRDKSSSLHASEKCSQKGKSSGNRTKGTKRQEEVYDADSETPIGYWPREDTASAPLTSHSNRKEKRILKSVVNTVSVPQNVASSSNSTNMHHEPYNGAYNNRYSPNDEEASHNYHLSTQSYKPLDLRMKDWKGGE